MEHGNMETLIPILRLRRAPIGWQPGRRTTDGTKHCTSSWATNQNPFASFRGVFLASCQQRRPKTAPSLLVPEGNVQVSSAMCRTRPDAMSEHNGRTGRNSLACLTDQTNRAQRAIGARLRCDLTCPTAALPGPTAGVVHPTIPLVLSAAKPFSDVSPGRIFSLALQLVGCPITCMTRTHLGGPGYYRISILLLTLAWAEEPGCRAKIGTKQGRPTLPMYEYIGVAAEGLARLTDLTATLNPGNLAGSQARRRVTHVSRRVATMSTRSRVSTGRLILCT